MFDRPRAEDPYLKLPTMPTFELVSSDIADGEPLPAVLAAIGASEGAGNVSPHLSWSGYPPETRSFVVSCFDPDAPTPSGFWHWTVIDIPADVTTLERGAPLPDGAIALVNDMGEAGYSGPMPPEGDFAHRYYFVVHAVSEAKLGLTSDAGPVIAAFTMLSAAVGRAQLVPTMQR